MTEKFFQLLVSNYNVASGAHLVNELKTGLSNNYVFEAGGTRYFLKQYRHTDFEKVREIHTVKKYLSEGGIPVIQPLRTNQQDTLVEIKGSMYAIFPYIEGFHQEEGRVSDVALDSLAKTLANIHYLSVTNPFVINDVFKDWDIDGFMSKAKEILKVINMRSELSELDLQMQHGVHMKIGLVRANTKTLASFGLPNNTLCHGDYHVYNIFFDVNDKVERVFDLEKAEMAPRVFELIRSMDYMNLGGNFDVFHMKKAKTYIDAYHSYYPLEKGEFAKGVEMRFIKDFHSLWVEGEVYLNNNSRFNRFYRSSFNTLQYLKDNLGSFIRYLEPVD